MSIALNYINTSFWSIASTLSSLQSTLKLHLKGCNYSTFNNLPCPAICFHTLSIQWKECTQKTEFNLWYVFLFSGLNISTIPTYETDQHPLSQSNYGISIFPPLLCKVCSHDRILFLNQNKIHTWSKPYPLDRCMTLF